MYTRRAVTLGVAAGALLGPACGDPEPFSEPTGDSGDSTEPSCESPPVDDGPYPYPDSCPLTAEEIEGPYYREGAPERADLDLYGDLGTPLTLEGQVFRDACDQPLGGAIVEVWHADPDGAYDNTSAEMRYRGRLLTDADGRFSLRTLLPGRYRERGEYRPRHLHVKVFDPDGLEQLTTQLFFEGDPSLACDPFSHTSLVLPFVGSEDTAVVATGVWLVVSPASRRSRRRPDRP